mgnify:CR=1 FL=1
MYAAAVEAADASEAVEAAQADETVASSEAESTEDSGEALYQPAAVDEAALAADGGVGGPAVIAEELLARLAGAFQAPLVKTAGLLQALPRNMAYGLKALYEKNSTDSAPEATEAAAPVAEEAPARRR